MVVGFWELSEVEGKTLTHLNKGFYLFNYFFFCKEEGIVYRVGSKKEKKTIYFKLWLVERDWFLDHVKKVVNQILGQVVN